MEKNSESVSDIIREMRERKLCMPRAKLDIDGDTYYVIVSLQDLADRIEAAHRREVEELKKKRREALEIASEVDKLASIDRQTEAMLKKNEIIAGLRRRLKIAEDALEAVRRLNRNTDLPITASQAACEEATKALAAIREEGGAE